MLSIKNNLFFLIFSCIVINSLNFESNVLALKHAKLQTSMYSYNSLSSKAMIVVVNPWEEHMKLYDIPQNHGAGVHEDLKGNIPIPGFIFSYSKYRYPAGKCPVFGKVLEIEGNANHTAYLDKIRLKKQKEKDLLENAKVGKISNLEDDANIGGLVFSSSDDQIFKKFSSPVLKDSLNDCVEYASSAEVETVDTDAVGNCKSESKKMCIKHPFAYDFISHKCYILYPTFQASNKSKIVFRPIKDDSLSHIVYGSSSITKNWKNYCPVRPLKGAIFGKWKNGECTKIERQWFPRNYYAAKTPAECASILFKNSPDDHPAINFKVSFQFKPSGEGYNWANYESGNCIIMKDVPDCLLFSQDGYGLTSTAISNPDMHDLPPCIHESTFWKIVAKCGNVNNGDWTAFECLSSGYWRASDGTEIKQCEPVEEWLKFSAADEPEHRNDTDNSNKKKKSGGASPLLIAGSVLGVVTIVGAASAGVYSYMKSRGQYGMNNDNCGSVEDQRAGDYDSQDKDAANWLQGNKDEL